MKNDYKGIKGLIKYIRDYKDNIKNAHQYNEYIDEKIKLQEQLNQLIFEKNMLEAELCEIEHKLKCERIDNKTRQNLIHSLNEEINKLTKKVEERELLRRKTAGQVGGLKAKVSVLKKDLARANQKINWLSNNQKAPTKEEIIAYETCMKKVEKNLKKNID